MTMVHPDIALPKAAVRALIDACGGAEAVCALLGLGDKSRSLIDGWANPNAPERRAPIEAVWRMEKFCGRAVVSEAGVRRIADNPALPLRPLSRDDMAVIAKEMADVLSAKAVAWADGHLDAADRRTLDRELSEAINTLIDVRNRVRSGA